MATRFTARKAFFNFLGSSFRIFGNDGGLLYYIKQKAFRLKEELVVFADEGQSKPTLRIKARNIFDTSATYDVIDAASGENVGACQRQGLRSMFRDEWHLLDADGAQIGSVKEDSLMMALLRRFLFKTLFPQTFLMLDIGGNPLGKIKQRFNPFQLSYDVEFDGIDHRLGVATTVLLLAIEGRQK